MPGGVFLAETDASSNHTDDELAAANALHCPRPTHSNNNANRTSSPSSLGRRSSIHSSTSAGSTGTSNTGSTVLSELNCVHSFDDQGRAASYLQFFKSNNSNNNNNAIASVVSSSAAAAAARGTRGAATEVSALTLAAKDVDEEERGAPTAKAPTLHQQPPPESSSSSAAITTTTTTRMYDTECTTDSNRTPTASQPAAAAATSIVRLPVQKHPPPLNDDEPYSINLTTRTPRRPATAVSLSAMAQGNNNNAKMTRRNTKTNVNTNKENATTTTTRSTTTIPATASIILDSRNDTKQKEKAPSTAAASPLSVEPTSILERSSTNNRNTASLVLEDPRRLSRGSNSSHSSSPITTSRSPYVAGTLPPHLVGSGLLSLSSSDDDEDSLFTVNLKVVDGGSSPSQRQHQQQPPDKENRYIYSRSATATTTNKNRKTTIYDTEDSISCLSSVSHLFGESLVSVSGGAAAALADGTEQHQPEDRLASGLTSPTQSNTNSSSSSSHPPRRNDTKYRECQNRHPSMASSSSQQYTTAGDRQQPQKHHSPRNNTNTNTLLGTVKDQVQSVVWKITRTTSDVLEPFFHHHRSTRRRQSSSMSTLQQPADLRYLMAQHKMKCAQLTMGGGTIDALQPVEDTFDFVLILQPQKVYGFWAELLDFRVELLGHDVVDAMEEQWGVDLEKENDRPTRLPLIRDTSSSTRSSSNNEEAQDTFSAVTPLSGVRRRRNNNHHQDEESMATTTPPLNYFYHNHNNTLSARRNHHTMVPSQASSRRSIASPGMNSGVGVNHDSLLNPTLTTASKKQSVFDRALESPALGATGSPGTISSSVLQLPLDGTAQKSVGVSSSNVTMTPLVSTYRRRWGNQVSGVGSTAKLPMMSPPVPCRPQQQSDLHNPRAADRPCLPLSESTLVNTNDPTNDDNSVSAKDSNSLRMQDIPNQVTARGLAARNSRTNGMQPFLDALKGGIVLRRHRPKQEATFCRMYSSNGGDTIRFQAVDRDEAIIAFREQRIRYNKSKHSGPLNNDDLPHWSIDKREIGKVENVAPHNFSVPDYVAADHRKRMAAKEGGRHCLNLIETMSDLFLDTAVNASKIVAVHAARNKDPRSNNNELGTLSLRRSKSAFNSALSFSLLTKSRNCLQKAESMEDLGVLWQTKRGKDDKLTFRNFEAATEGEYWLVFRGLLLLYRDAVVGRFAKQRASGTGTNVDLSSDVDIRLHVDEFHEPSTVGWLEKAIVNGRGLDTTYMEGFITTEDAVPPPSDYFLGFRSPGTAIWSRLRQAGLETRRIYSLDPNRVMIKIRCPSDRLMDVAEVLRVKLKTKDGLFAPFSEDMIEAFDSGDDSLECLPPHNMDWSTSFQFKSCLRQSIIAFIIGSRIRDSGAELGPTTELGQFIQARVPLHVHSTLNAIFHSWFYFWAEDNWYNGRTGHSLTYANSQSQDNGTLSKSNKLSIERGDSDLSSTDARNHDSMPNLFTRFFVGCMHQPLDSIESYFGEKVAFYFTWLQHTATHLVLLSIAGLIVFFFQLSSGIVDHPLRPYFAFVIMIWTFVVLINWKKRANFMAYRWGTMNYKEQETTRPQFKGEYTLDGVTGEWIVTCPKWKRWLKYCISFPLTLLFTGGTLLLILWVHANRDIQLAKYFQKDDDLKEFKVNDFALHAIGERAQIVEVELTTEHLQNPQFWFIVVLVPSMLGLFLPLLNFGIMKVATMLNDFENYRTESEYRTYLIIKVFSFRFVCYFATLYYYSIISLGDKQAIENGILRVGTGVLIYTTVAQWWQNILHVCFPMIVRSVRMKHRRQRLANELRDIEQEEEEIMKLSATRIDDSVRERQVRLINKRLLLEHAQDDTWLELMNPDHDSFPEYIQAVVQFAFVSCFSVVLPITPLIVLFNHLISMRLDAYKLCKGRRRPVAEKTGGIGVWEHVLHIVAVISVLTNCWLMGFTSSQFEWMKKNTEGEGGNEKSSTERDLGLFMLIVGWEHIMLLIKYVMSNSVSHLPKSVRDAMKRERYEIDKQRKGLMQERRKHQQQNEDSETIRKLSSRFCHRNSRNKSVSAALGVSADEDDVTISSSRSSRNAEV